MGALVGASLKFVKSPKGCNFFVNYLLFISVGLYFLTVYSGVSMIDGCKGEMGWEWVAFREWL